jgi:anti-sigma B factor antagonist
MNEEFSDPQDVVRDVRYEGSTVILELAGEIDMERSVEVKQKLKELFQKKPSRLVVNMSDVKLIDSSGLATLVGALRWCRTNGSTLRLAGMAENVRSIFEICRLDTIFQICDTEAEALS